MASTVVASAPVVSIQYLASNMTMIVGVVYTAQHFDLGPGYLGVSIYGNLLRQVFD